MMEMSIQTRYAVTLSGIAFAYLGLLFLISSLVHFYYLAPFSIQIDLFIIVIGSIMTFIGLLGFHRNSSEIPLPEISDAKT